MNVKDVSKEMVKEEYELSQRLLKLAETIDSGVIKALLTTVAFDSEKHSHLYIAILDLLDKSRKMVPESDIEKIQDEIELHIKIESKMYQTVKSLLEDIDDPKIKMILQLIMEDEIRHHKIFQELKNVIMSKEALTEDVVWDMVWKDAVFHGGPGG
ncbi:MAG: ferritin-like domain-containing protein [Nitrososphaeria archaeon]|nr:ferritin-like domain-containing protein [Nitrososphaeria archaeon]